MTVWLAIDTIALAALAVSVVVLWRRVTRLQRALSGLARVGHDNN